VATPKGASEHDTAQSVLGGGKTVGREQRRFLGIYSGGYKVGFEEGYFDPQNSKI